MPRYDSLSATMWHPLDTAHVLQLGLCHNPDARAPVMQLIGELFRRLARVGEMKSVLMRHQCTELATLPAVQRASGEHETSEAAPGQDAAAQPSSYTKAGYVSEGTVYGVQCGPNLVNVRPPPCILVMCCDVHLPH